MSKKFNNKYLIIIFGVLILLFIFVKFYRSVKTERTLKTDIVEVDTAKVDKILLYPSSEKGQELTFIREGNSWTVSNGKIKTETEKNDVTNLLSQLLQIKSKRLVSRSKDKWEEYQLTDTSATRIKVFEGGKEKTDLLIGKFTYQQTRDPYGRSGITGTSYVRLTSEDEVYANDGFLSFTFNQSFNNWRNQSLISLNKADITRLTFRYPGDSSFVVSFTDKKWMLGNLQADSVKVVNFLNTITNKKASTFDDTFTPVGNSQYQLTIEGNNMSNITIDAFSANGDAFKINSSMNTKSWFSSDAKGLFKDIFKSKKEFIPSGKK